MNKELSLTEITYQQLKSRIVTKEFFSVDLDFYEDEEDFFGRHTILFYDGDLTIPYEFGTGLYDGGIILVVKGNLEVQGVLANSFFVQGNLKAEALLINPDSHQTVQGQTQIQFFEAIQSADDEALFTLPKKHQTTAPFVFCYYVDLNTLEFKNTPVVLDVKDSDDYEGNEVNREDMFWIKGSWGPFLFADHVAWSHIPRLSDEAYGIVRSYLLSIMKKNGTPFAFEVSKEMLKRYDEAHKTHTNSSFEKAYPQLVELTKTHPEFYLPTLHVGMSLAELADYEAAIPFLEKANAVFPQNIIKITNQAAEYLSHCYLRLGNIAEAEKYADLTLNKQDETFRAQQVKAEILFTKGNYAEALLHAEKAKELKWGSTSPLILLALIHHHLGHPKEAKEFLAEAQKSDPKISINLATTQNLDFLFKKQTSFS